jgi:hypothetical protein
VRSLSLNQPEYAQITTPYSVDQWNFSARADEQIQFKLLNASSPGVVFTLSGPNGWGGFTNLTSSSGLVTLPYDGAYSLSAIGTGGAYGIGYAFEFVQTPETNLVGNGIFAGNFAGSGQPQLIAITITNSGPLLITLNNSGAGNVTELYAKFGTAPTRGTFGYESINPISPNQQILIPSAIAGIYYILVYGNLISTPGSYTVSVTSANVFLTSATPNLAPYNANFTLSLAGSGFLPSASVAPALVAATRRAIWNRRTRVRDDETFTGRAQRLLNAKSGADENPSSVNLQIARTYIAAANPEMLERTWRGVFDAMTPLKEGPTQERWERAGKDEAYKTIWDVTLMETQPDLILKTLNSGTVATNVFLRRMHNFAIDMNWLLGPILPKTKWPKIKHQETRAITAAEHKLIIDGEANAERRDFYELCWYLRESDESGQGWSRSATPIRDARCSTVCMVSELTVVFPVSDVAALTWTLFCEVVPADNAAKVVRACTPIDRIVGVQPTVGQQPRHHTRGRAGQRTAATHETARDASAIREDKVAFRPNRLPLLARRRR